MSAGHIDVTASTGMSSLQFETGETIHHWSGYGDGHLHMSKVIERVMFHPSYEATKRRIQECECLLIDEVGLISAKLFDGVEIICR